MKTFIVTFRTNYGLSVFIINADDEHEAKSIAENNEAWDNYEIFELLQESKGLIFDEHS